MIPILEGEKNQLQFQENHQLTIRRFAEEYILMNIKTRVYR